MRFRLGFWIIALTVTLFTKFSLVSEADSATTIPIIFKSIDVDGWTFPQNSEALSENNHVVVDVFPPCNSTIKADCILSVEYQNSSGKWIKGKFAQPMPYKMKIISNGNSTEQVVEESNDPISFKEDPSRNIPALSRSGYWSFPGLKHGLPACVSFLLAPTFGRT